MSILNLIFSKTEAINGYDMPFLYYIPILIATLLFGAYLIYNNKVSRKFEIITASMLLLIEIFYYIWCISSKVNLIDNELPFYHCNISLLLIVIGSFLNKKILLQFGSYIGLLSSILALILPWQFDYVFPHITVLSYFITHSLLFISSLYYLFIKNIGMSKKSLKNSLIAITLYNIFTFVFNHIFQSNYGFTREIPSNLNFALPSIYCLLLTTLVFCLMFTAEFLVLNRKNN